MLNGSQLECEGEELRPDGTCPKCDRINARVDPPAAPTEFAAGWQTCGVAPDDSRLVRMKFQTSESASDFVDRMAGLNIPVAPPAPDEADKALAKRIVGGEERALYDFYALMDRVAAALAQARKETWEKAIKVVTKVHERTLGSVSDWQVLGPLESAMKKDLESASKQER